MTDLPMRKQRLATNRANVILKNLAVALNGLLSKKRPATINSSWILRHAPACYRAIQKWIRNETGGIDWDRVTSVLDPVHQRRWRPPKRKMVPYQDPDELQRLVSRYESQLYVFVNAPDAQDRHLRDTVSIALVRVAQKGNVLARQELMKLIGYTINDWIERHPPLSRWRGYEEEVRRQIEGCIRRYRYTGSFIRYLYKTLEYAARGIRPLIAYSLDEPLRSNTGRRIDLIPCALN